MIESTESAILDRAEILVSPFGLKVEPFPEDPDSYVLTHPKGAVLAVYKGSSYGPSIATDVMVQERAMHYELVILIKNLRKHQGAYAVIDALRAGFAGWLAPEATKNARILRDEFRGRDATAWQWALGVEIPAISLPDDPVEESQGILLDTTIQLEI